MRCPLAGSHLRWNASERPERCPRSKVPPPGSIPRHCRARRSRARSFSFNSGHSPASTGFARFAYIREWAQDYRKAGLVVIGVHTPEFDFERHLANVRRETQDLKVQYPVAVDSDSAIWRAL